MDRDLLHAFRAGDPMAVKAIYDEFGGAVYALAYRVLGDREMASDVTQVTFMKAWRASATYDVERGLAPWLYAIARRTAIDTYRKSRRQVPTEGVDTVVRAPGLEAAWETFEVRSALDRLPDDERVIVKMSHLDGLTHVEIAEELDIPVGTVKSRSHRAHRRLQALLSHLGEM